MLHKVLLDSRTDLKGKSKETETSWVEVGSSEDASGLPKVVYEINSESDHFEPRLRVIVSNADDNIVSFPALPPSETELSEQLAHATIEDIEEAPPDESKLAVPTESRGRDAGSSGGKRSHSTSPEPIMTCVVTIFSWKQH